MGYNGYTEKKKASNERYIKNNDLVQILFRVKREEKNEILDHISKSGKSANQFICEAVWEKIEREEANHEQ